MIRKYTFGNPFPTEAVVKEIPASEGLSPISPERATAWSSPWRKVLPCTVWASR